MSKEQDSATNKSLRVGISGENALPTLDHFSVETKLDNADESTGLTLKEVAERNAVPIALILGDPNHPLHAMTKDLMARLESGEISLS